jgi:hypothetical protein
MTRARITGSVSNYRCGSGTARRVEGGREKKQQLLPAIETRIPMFPARGLWSRTKK